MACVLRSTPVDEGFGLVSILSAIDRESLDVVNRASLSGRLASKIKVVIRPLRNGRSDTMNYCVMPSTSATRSTVRNRGLASDTVYR